MLHATDSNDRLLQGWRASGTPQPSNEQLCLDPRFCQIYFASMDVMRTMDRIPLKSQHLQGSCIEQGPPGIIGLGPSDCDPVAFH